MEKMGFFSLARKYFFNISLYPLYFLNLTIFSIAPTYEEKHNAQHETFSRVYSGKANSTYQRYNYYCQIPFLGVQLETFMTSTEFLSFVLEELASIIPSLVTPFR